MSDPAALKVCPWCGSPGKLASTQFGGFNVVCQDPRYWDSTTTHDESCGMSGPDRASAEEAIAAWNRRAPTSEETQTQIAELKQTVIAFCGPWAASYARERGLPDRHLYHTHYDILKDCGARVDDFVRAEVPGGEKSDV